MAGVFRIGSIRKFELECLEEFPHDEPMNWIWGLSLVALTIAIHATAVVVMALVALKIRVRIENRSFGLRHEIRIVIGLVALAGLVLAMLHGIEAAIWAAVMGKMPPEPIACTARPSRNSSKLGASAAIIDPIPNRVMPDINVRFRPNLSDSFPMTGILTAKSSV